jgi:hypothetical protein
MSRFRRILLTFLLVVALPLQGGVAAAMMCCVPVQAHAMAAQHDGAPDLQAMPAHCAETAAPDAGAPQPPVACSSCAACCIAGALASAALPLFADTAFHERPLADRSRSPSFIAEVTEHPPRSASV